MMKGTPRLLIEEHIQLPIEERQKHLRLNEPCLERGGTSMQHQGIMVVFFNTTFPAKRVAQLQHACGNGKCSNPQHLYWGTPKENMTDARKHGTLKTCWEYTVAKYGYDKALKLRFYKGYTPWNKGKKLGPQSLEHIQKRVESRKQRKR